MQDLPEIGARVRYSGPTPWAYHQSTGQGVVGTVIAHVPIYRGDTQDARIAMPPAEWHVRVAIDRRPRDWRCVQSRFAPKVRDIEPMR